MQQGLMEHAEATRSSTVLRTDRFSREKYSQYLTPYQTARLAASMFSPLETTTHIHCLDLGAGTGILSVALFERYGQQIVLDAIELDGVMAERCRIELGSYGISHNLIHADVLDTELMPIYKRIILNPPYKKMAAKDKKQHLLPTRSPNLYTAFIMKGIQALCPDGELVAIIPRSWMNGRYFEPFRNWLLQNASLDAMHIYKSRSEVFSDTNVLQEIMLVKISKKTQSETITISESANKNDFISYRQFPANELIGSDEQKIITVSPNCSHNTHETVTLKSAGFCASTGKIVDFRNKEYIREYFESGCRKLIYPCNFRNGIFVHPVSNEKPQWISAVNETVTRQLIDAGSYVVVKRFSSKEEKRRIKAYYLELTSPEALENHLNFIHAGTARNVVPLDPVMAKGLVLWLNSSHCEEWFRARSGSTQVNASDLNDAPVPSANQLHALGLKWQHNLLQEEIDLLCNQQNRS